MSSARRPQLVLTTASASEAAQLANRLVEERLAACVSRVAVASTYRWQGEVHDDDEVLLLIKTSDDLLAALEARVQQLHSYDVPEFLVLDPVAVSDTYLAWLLESAG
jgi:periplasmic divalent cation tolerance protein